MRKVAAPEKAPPPRNPRAASPGLLAAWLALAGAAAGFTIAYVSQPPWSHLGLASQLPSQARRAFALTVVLGFGAGVIAGAVAALRAQAAARERLLPVARLTAIGGLAPLLLDHAVWAGYPVFAALVALLVVALAFRWWPSRPGAYTEAAGGTAARRAALATWLAIALYAVVLSVAAVAQHRMLETRAYDLGIMENVLWNSAHGRWFASALEGGSHLGVHSSFILALLLPFYAFLPRAETLLAAQSVLLALAAWPLYLLARDRLGSAWQAFCIAAIYLVHPAVAGANLYDFHELAFTPVLFFLSLWLVERGRSVWAAVCLFLLLCVKEDMSILVGTLGAMWLLEGRRRFGALALTAGAGGYVLLQHVAIPYFAGGEHAYTWYFGDMVAPGEGPGGVLMTLLMSPVQALASMATAAKIGYLMTVLMPLAMLPLAAGAAVLPLGYGALTALAADRPPLFELGFQYALLLVPPAFNAALVALRRRVPGGDPDARGRRGRWVAAMVALSALSWYHYGFGVHGNAFRSGFRQPRLAYTPADARRYAEIRELAAVIPPEASVTASETLVPQVCRRQRVQTLRYAADAFGGDYDVFFLLGEDDTPETHSRFPHVFDPAQYELVRRGAYAAVYRRLP